VARKLNLFLSYSSEDFGLATALQQALQGFLDKDFVEIWLDKQDLRAGFDLSTQIRDQLDQTDILIVVYTGQQKASHSYTGIEVGYFMATMKREDQEIKRRIVAFYLDSPPDATAGISAIPFDIDKPMLTQSSEEYNRSLEGIDTKHRIALLLEDLERTINTIRVKECFKKNEYDDKKRLDCVRQVLHDSFNVLKKRKDIDINPQKKLIIEVGGNLTSDAIELPGTAILRPEGFGTMAIFGMPERPISWSDFLRNAKDRYRDVWKDVIETVLMTSLDQLEADNSQIIMSVNDRALELYRVLLSRNTRFFDGRREFHLYFVEVFKRPEYGDDYSTRLLKALGLCCRFRFMFFEIGSDFSSANLEMIDENEIYDYARRLIKELNLLQRDSVEAKLGDPRVWAQLLSPGEKGSAPLGSKNVWEPLIAMKREYDPLEAGIREAATAILVAKKEDISAARAALVESIRKLEEAFREKNRELIRDLADRIKELPDHTHALLG
jgi:TIR domain